jgi:hypothetical protein
MDIETTYTYDAEGNLIDTVTVEVPVAPEVSERRQAVADYKDATQALLASNVAATTKQWVRAQNRLLKAIVAELKDEA